MYSTHGVGLSSVVVRIVYHPQHINQSVAGLVCAVEDQLLLLRGQHQALLWSQLLAQPADVTPTVSELKARCHLTDENLQSVL